MSASTRTTERTEARVETVTVEEVQCPVCEQWYADDDELVAVAVGATYEPDGEIVTAAHETRVCRGCTASLFDVDVSHGRQVDRVHDALQRPLVDLGDASIPPGAIRAVAFVAIGLAVTGIVASEVLATMQQQVAAGEVQKVGAPLGFLNLLPVLVLIVVSWPVVRMPRMRGSDDPA
jgi:hypothetical protein